MRVAFLSHIRILAKEVAVVLRTKLKSPQKQGTLIMGGLDTLQTRLVGLSETVK